MIADPVASQRQPAGRAEDELTGELDAFTGNALQRVLAEKRRGPVIGDAALLLVGLPATPRDGRGRVAHLDAQVVLARDEDDARGVLQRRLVRGLVDVAAEPQIDRRGSSCELASQRGALVVDLQGSAGHLPVAYALLREVDEDGLEVHTDVEADRQRLVPRLPDAVMRDREVDGQAGQRAARLPLSDERGQDVARGGGRELPLAVDEAARARVQDQFGEHPRVPGHLVGAGRRPVGVLPRPFDPQEPRIRRLRPPATGRVLNGDLTRRLQPGGALGEPVVRQPQRRHIVQRHAGLEPEVLPQHP